MRSLVLSLALVLVPSLAQAWPGYRDAYGHYRYTRHANYANAHNHANLYHRYGTTYYGGYGSSFGWGYGVGLSPFGWPAYGYSVHGNLNNPWGSMYGGYNAWSSPWWSGGLGAGYSSYGGWGAF